MNPNNATRPADNSNKHEELSGFLLHYSVPNDYLVTIVDDTSVDDTSVILTPADTSMSEETSVSEKASVEEMSAIEDTVLPDGAHVVEEPAIVAGDDEQREPSRFPGHHNEPEELSGFLDHYSEPVDENDYPAVDSRDPWSPDSPIDFLCVFFFLVFNGFLGTPTGNRNLVNAFVLSFPWFYHKIFVEHLNFFQITSAFGDAFFFPYEYLFYLICWYQALACGTQLEKVKAEDTVVQASAGENAPIENRPSVLSTLWETIITGVRRVAAFLAAATAPPVHEARAAKTLANNTPTADDPADQPHANETKALAHLLGFTDPQRFIMLILLPLQLLNYLPFFTHTILCLSSPGHFHSALLLASMFFGVLFSVTLTQRAMTWVQSRALVSPAAGWAALVLVYVGWSIASYTAAAGVVSLVVPGLLRVMRATFAAGSGSTGTVGQYSVTAITWSTVTVSVMVSATGVPTA